MSDSSKTQFEQIFISYAREDDEAFVKQLYEDLKNRFEFSVWWDREAMESRGLTFQQEIRDAIIRTERFLLVWGPAAQASDYVTSEWQHALEYCKPIMVILRIGQYEDVPDTLRRYHGPSFSASRDYEEALSELVRLLQTRVAALGVLRGVPDVPKHHLMRDEILETLTQYILPDVMSTTVITSGQQTTALYGMGGIGKSVIAADFARSCDVRRAFSDGIIWLTAGRNASVLALLRQVGVLIGDQTHYYNDEATARLRLQEMIADRAILLILDDVWEIEVAQAFQAVTAQTRSRLLMTTRLQQIPKLLAANACKVELLSRDEAITLLQKWAGRAEERLHEIADRLRYLPLALKLVGARLRDGMQVAEWLQAFSHVSDIKLVGGASDRSSSLEASIAISLQALPENQIPLYQSLGIFPEDYWIPQEAVSNLWMMLHQDIGEKDCYELLERLEQLALIERNYQDKTIWLHDLLHDYNRQQLGSSYHTILLEYLKHASRWLSHHYQTRQNRNMTLEFLFTQQYLELHQHDQRQAERFLKQWLKQKEDTVKISEESAPYTSKFVAVQSAFYAEACEPLLNALLHREEAVRSIAIIYAYHLYRQHPAMVFEQILQPLANRCRWWGFPVRKNLGTFFYLLSLVLIFEYNFQKGEAARIPRLIALGTKTLQKAVYMRSALLRPISRWLRKGLIRVGVPYLINRLPSNQQFEQDAATDTAITIEELELFFDYIHAEDAPFRRIVPYLRQTEADLKQEMDALIKIYGGDPDADVSFAAVVITAMAITIQGLHDPDHVQPILDKLVHIPRDVGRNERYINLIGTWRHILLRQPAINPAWVDFAHQLCTEYFNQVEADYGVVTNQVGVRYEYYPLTWYCQIYNRWQPDQPIDLLEVYLEKANQQYQTQGSAAFLIHIIKGFADPRSKLDDYQWLLETFTPYLLHADPTIRQATINVVARIRGKAQYQVDEYLKDPVFLEGSGLEVKGAIHANTFGESPLEVAMEGLQDAVMTLLASPDSQDFNWLFEGIEVAANQPTIALAGQAMAHYFLNLLESQPN